MLYVIFEKRTVHLQTDLRTDRKLSASSFDSILTPQIARDMEDSQFPSQMIEYCKIWIISKTCLDASEEDEFGPEYSQKRNQEDHYIALQNTTKLKPNNNTGQLNWLDQ